MYFTESGEKMNNHFPMAEYREGQKEVIDFCVNSLKDKRIVILECPTGSGKSPIALTLMDMVPKSYYITVTKQLQDQLIKDFGDSPTTYIKDPTKQIVELKGRNAYKCTYYERYGSKLVQQKLWNQSQLDQWLSEQPNCNNGFCASKYNPEPNKTRCQKCFLASNFLAGTDIPRPGILTELPDGLKYSACPYYDQVYKAINSRKIVMNFSSFLFQTTFTDRFKRRNLLIIDESHQTESEIMSFVSLSISDFKLRKYGIFIPKLKSALAYSLFFEEVELAKILNSVIQDAMAEDNKRLADDMINILHKYNIFMSRVQDAEWVCEYEDKKNYRSVNLKPVFIMKYPEELLFKYADKIIMMSATILDPSIMCKSLGIDRSEVATYRMKNRFPIENRPIYYKPVGKLTGGKDKMAEWIPKLVKGVDQIMDKYPNVKGIIHTHNFAIMDNLIRKCKNSSRDRFLNQRDFETKDEMLKHHATCKNSVIIAPAMHEGIDLIGDLSRFQIICKIPYPNCYDDAQLARRVELDRRFYNWIVALKLIQSYGRSIRSIDDFADTYVLDGSFEKFRSDAKNLLPDWFIEAVK